MTERKKTLKREVIKVELPIYKRWSTYLYIVGFLLLMFLIYIIYRVQISERKLFTLSFIPLLLGIIYENKRLSTHWGIIGLKITGSFILSLFVLFPDKHEINYDFETHVEVWPFAFLGFFILISVIFHDKKIVPKLTEGITLIQSVSILYWIIDFNFFENLNLFSVSLLSIVLIIALYSLLHAFTYIPLSKNHRLFLSIWSSIIMLVFATEHIFSVFNSKNIEDADVANGCILTLEYFILGISSIYILQNFFMLTEYLPSKRRFYDKEHRKDIKAMNKTHIERYSDKQVMKVDSFLCLLYCLFFYFINYKYQLMHRQTAIWLVILTLPYFIYLKEKLYPNNET